MMRQFGKHWVWLAIVSARRPSAVPHMTSKVGPATWYTPPDDEEAYQAQGNGHVRTVPVSGHAPGGDVESLTGMMQLPSARNRALEDAFVGGRPCVQLDDDLQKVELVEDGAVGVVEPTWAITHLLNQLMDSDYMLAGGQPTTNAYFARGGTTLFIINSIVAVRPSAPRMDTRLALKHDYDFTARHVAEYGGALRVADLMFDFTHYSNEGGCESYRNDQLEQAEADYLVEKWPGWVKPHPQRKGEVMLRAHGPVPADRAMEVV